MKLCEITSKHDAIDEDRERFSISREKNTLEARRAYLDKKPRRVSPSQEKLQDFSRNQEKPEPDFHFDRPSNAAASIPVTLLHSVFGKFIDDCDSYTPTKEDYALTLEISCAMSKFYTNNDKRMSAFREIMNKHGFDIRASAVEGNDLQTDGDTRFGGLCPLIVVGEVEIGATGVEPLLKGAHYYLESCRGKAGEINALFPCIVLYVFGGSSIFVCFEVCIKQVTRFPYWIRRRSFHRTSQLAGPHIAYAALLPQN